MVFVVMHLFLLSMKMQSPVVLDNISQPCLEILYHIIKPEAPTSKKHKVYTRGTFHMCNVVSGT